MRVLFPDDTNEYKINSELVIESVEDLKDKVSTLSDMLSGLKAFSAKLETSIRVYRLSEPVQHVLDAEDYKRWDGGYLEDEPVDIDDKFLDVDHAYSCELDVGRTYARILITHEGSNHTLELEIRP